MNKIQTSGIDVQTKPRRLGRGLSALLGEAVPVKVPTTVEESTRSVPMVEPKAVPAMPAAPAPPSGTRAAALAPAHQHVTGSADPGRIVAVPLNAIEVNRFQPRRTFDES